MGLILSLDVKLSNEQSKLQKLVHCSLWLLGLVVTRSTYRNTFLVTQWHKYRKAVKQRLLESRMIQFTFLSDIVEVIFLQSCSEKSTYSCMLKAVKWASFYPLSSRFITQSCHSSLLFITSSYVVNHSCAPSINIFEGWRSHCRH